MSQLEGASPLSLLELAKRKNPNGTLATIAEVLTKENAILKDAVWMEGNDTFSHKIVRRLSLPTGSWRRLNSGVATEASQTIEVIENMGILESWSQSDVDLVDAAPSPKKFRMDESKSFLEGMSQTLATTQIYGNGMVDTEQFTGLAPRLNATSQNNVISGSGSGGDTTSIFMVQWGRDKVHMVYPRGSANMGVRHWDRGIRVIDESMIGGTAGRKFEAYVDKFQVKAGLAVRDERCIARVANIESSGTSNIFDEDDVITLINRMPNQAAGAVIYCNRTIKTQMDINAKDKTNVNYYVKNVWGEPTTTFRGIPVRQVDAIVDTETAIS